jgi:hypothetical protein
MFWTFIFGRIFIAASISSCVIDLFRRLTSSWFSSDGHKYLEICPFLQDFSNLLEYVLKIVSEDSLYFLGVCFCLPFFISDFTFWGLFLPHFSQICQGFGNLVYFFKEPAFCLVDSLYVIFFCLYFINFGHYFYYFSPV